MDLKHYRFKFYPMASQSALRFLNHCFLKVLSTQTEKPKGFPRGQPT
jgi:hypothetical protein